MKRFSVLALAFGVIVMAACAAPAAAPTGGESAAATAAPAAAKPTIKLAESPWSASELNVIVARILLEEQLGYPVEVTSIDENAQWPALAKGELDASLEVWPSGHAKNVEEYIDKQGLVENGGPLGVVGKIGWYTPSYMVDKDPSLATWEGFLKPATAALYATAETGAKGQFLAGDPSWVGYDDQIIKNLGIDFQIVNAASEDAILAALNAAESREEPLLFYFWTPHSIHARYDLTQVELPAYSEECYAKAVEGGVDCDYPSDILFKIFWSGLKDVAPEAFTLLKNINYTTEDQIAMIAAVELDGKTPEEAARAWLDANQDTWQAWLP